MLNPLILAATMAFAAAPANAPKNPLQPLFLQPHIKPSEPLYACTAII